PRAHGPPVLVEPALDEAPGPIQRQADSMRIEEHFGDPGLEVGDDVEDLRVEERLADAVQNDAIEDGELFGDLPDMLEAEIGRRLPRLEGADARLAFRVAPIRRLPVHGTGQTAP